MSAENTNQVVKKSKSPIVDQVMSKVMEFQKDGGLKLPANYSAYNAVRGAELALMEIKDKSGKNALETCTQASIATSLLKMVVLGLNPLKSQVAFIPYGGKLELSIQYQGKLAIAKRHGVKAVRSNVIYKGDEFDYKIDVNGKMEVKNHKQSFGNIGGEILGAYAIVEMEDGTTEMEVMTMPQIEQSWKQGATNGNSPAHRNFKDQMAKKTVINRALKLFIQGSDDANLFDDEEQPKDYVKASVKHEIDTNANKEEMGFDAEDVDYEELKEDESNTNSEIQETKEVAQEVQPNNGPAF